MALSFDDKMLGEKVHNYCDESDDEERRRAAADNDDGDEAVADDSGNKEDGDGGAAGQQQSISMHRIDAMSAAAAGRRGGGGGAGASSQNTGPKGVLEDWRQFKQFERERDALKQQLVAALHKESALTSERTVTEEQQQDAEDAEFLEMMEGLDGMEEVLQEYSRKRILEMKQAIDRVPKFDRVFTLRSGAELLETIEDAELCRFHTLILVHVFDAALPACEAVDGCFQALHSKYPHIKWCRFDSFQSAVSASLRSAQPMGAQRLFTQEFCERALPTIIGYRDGALVHNWIALREELGDDFYADQLEQFMRANGFKTEPSPLAMLSQSGGAASK